MNMKQERIIRLPEVIQKVGLKKSCIYQYISEGIFPQRVNLGPRAVGWYESEIDSWITSRALGNKLCN